MALVLRKAVLPKNVSLLKCIKGRTLVTATNKNNPTPLPAGVFRCSLKDATKLKPLGHVKIIKMNQLPAPRRRGEGRPSRAVRRCFSCPELVPLERARPFVPPRHLSPPRTRPLFYDAIPLPRFQAASPFCPLTVPNASFLNPYSALSIAKRGYAAKPCPPCGPCGCGCGCLPPPCNTPPKCIQYITGYYYYPYGTWFCGPYHVGGLSCCCSNGCGACGPCCKCCVCCITPAAAALLPMSTTVPLAPSLPADAPLRFQEVQKPAEYEKNAADNPTPAKDPPKASRQGLAKFFPFNNTGAALGAVGVANLLKQDEMDLQRKLWAQYDPDSNKPIKVSKSDPEQFDILGQNSSKWKTTSSYSRKTSIPQHRKYSRCATDYYPPSKASLSRIRRKQPPKKYLWEVFDGSRSSSHREPFDDFKPYDA